MTTQVTFPNGNQYSTDGSTAHDMQGYGYTENLLALAGDQIDMADQIVLDKEAAAQSVVDAAEQVGLAEDAATAAELSEAHAENSAVDALASKNAAAGSVIAAGIARTGAETARTGAEAAFAGAVAISIDDTGTGVGLVGKARSADYLSKDHGGTPISTDQIVVAGGYYVADTRTRSPTYTLPVAPSIGFRFCVRDAFGTFNTFPVILARNGQPIMGKAENMNLNSRWVGFTFVYQDAIQGWVMA